MHAHHIHMNQNNKKQRALNFAGELLFVVMLFLCLFLILSL